ncbi:hypothetical protein FQN54_002231 [Arachnomyces sp. PD_36]|nr:hypothetical protein FQN54_002231 [Arachnomyces sp. PD_36]
MKSTIASVSMMALALSSFATADVSCTGGKLQASFKPGLSNNGPEVHSVSIQGVATSCTSTDPEVQVSAVNISIDGHGAGGCDPVLSIHNGEASGELRIEVGDDSPATRVRGTFEISIPDGIQFTATAGDGPYTGSSIILESALDVDLDDLTQSCLTGEITDISAVVKSLNILEDED